VIRDATERFNREKALRAELSARQFWRRVAIVPDLERAAGRIQARRRPVSRPGDRPICRIVV